MWLWAMPGNNGAHSINYTHLEKSGNRAFPEDANCSVYHVSTVYRERTSLSHEIRIY
jgi:hypothetical protein